MWVCVVSWELPGQSKWFSGAAVIKFNWSASGALLLNLALLIEFQVTVKKLCGPYFEDTEVARSKFHRIAF